MTALRHDLPLAITMGDPAGIGPEIILKSFALHPEVMHHCFVVGDLGVLQQRAHMLGLDLKLIQHQSASQTHACPDGAVPIVQVGSPHSIAIGQVSAQAGRMAADAVIWAAQAALRGEVAAVVTAPLHKKALSLAGVQHPGHTELLQSLAADHLGIAVQQLPVRMMLSSPGLSTVLVSIHLSLRQAIEAVTQAQVLQTLQITHSSWLQMHGRAPRMVVAGLNPHAGEDGLFGLEEINDIAPAIAQAQQLGMQVKGPFPPDTVFMDAHSPAGQASTDVVIAMYHDQGLIPVKYLGLAHGVNHTLGLPFVRTSPDHGTAFDIASLGLADPSSLMAAVKAARGERRISA